MKWNGIPNTPKIIKEWQNAGKDLVHMDTSDLVFLNKLKIIFLSFKKIEKNIRM
jgi:pentose-5-phosphate-3-epimerase